MDDKRLDAQLRFLTEVDRMKTIERQTTLFTSDRRENDAEHSWHIAVMAMILREYASEPVDMGHVLEMLAVHDVIEVYAGDTFAYDTSANTTKQERECAAADRLYAILPPEQGAYYRALWEEFDAMATPDSRFAASVDRLAPLIANWLNNGYSWRNHSVSSEQIYKRMAPIKTAAPRLWEYADDIIKRSMELGHIKE